MVSGLSTASPAAVSFRSATYAQRNRRQNRDEPGRELWHDSRPTQLHRAALEGSIERILVVLATGSVDIDQGDADGMTPLMMAAVMGYSHIVKTLLKEGADVSRAADPGVTALHTFLVLKREGPVAVVELLVGAGADVEATYEGCTPLHMATCKGTSEAVRALMEAGANPDRRLPTGVTPLHIAAESGRVDTMRELPRSNIRCWSMSHSHQKGAVPSHWT